MNTEQLTKRIAELERRNPATSPAVDIAELEKAVSEIIKRMTNEFIETPDGPIRYCDASPEQQKKHNDVWLTAHPASSPELNVEREVRKVHHILPLVQGVST
ncbi:MAG: hypothetical protein STSR0009_30210 [Methanoregula sp.]